MLTNTAIFANSEGCSENTPRISNHLLAPFLNSPKIKTAPKPIKQTIEIIQKYLGIKSLW